MRDFPSHYLRRFTITLWRKQLFLFCNRIRFKPQQLKLLTFTCIYAVEYRFLPGFWDSLLAKQVLIPTVSAFGENPHHVWNLSLYEDRLPADNTPFEGKKKKWHVLVSLGLPRGQELRKWPDLGCLLDGTSPDVWNICTPICSTDISAASDAINNDADPKRRQKIILHCSLNLDSSYITQEDAVKNIKITPKLKTIWLTSYSLLGDKF